MLTSGFWLVMLVFGSSKFGVVFLATSSMISSSSSGRVLGFGFDSSKVTSKYSSTTFECLFKTLYALLVGEYPRKTPSYALGSNFVKYSLLLRMKHLHPN